ncbi:unnamed protein product [Ranitomeya imitator]|uniref:Uncharacterized protein n=1 Tax=Ranitomeya imitator TaxID=111125 RepID=A0ABN9KSU1_9NEOB|nr:unnamed protein product [Ranitomeya imitator]
MSSANLRNKRINFKKGFVIEVLEQVNHIPRRDGGHKGGAQTTFKGLNTYIVIVSVYGSDRFLRYLKDTTHFLASLRDLGVLPKGCTLVTMDVSLYTSIEHQNGMEAVKLFLMQHTDFSNDQMAFCRDLLSLILTKNFFLFEDQFFFQIPHMQIYLWIILKNYLCTLMFFLQHIFFIGNVLSTIFSLFGLVLVRTSSSSIVTLIHRFLVCHLPFILINIRFIFWIQL